MAKLELDRKLGRYHLTRMLGRGGMGVVLLGEDPFIERRVAIKTTLAPPPADPKEFEEFRRLFFHEARAAGRLTHPNIVSVYDAAVERDRCYLVMEYVDGVSLKEYCHKDKTLPLEQAVKVIFQCAKALHYAHQHGVIHRDIKPANIMISKAGQVKITDFGIASIKGAPGSPAQDAATMSFFYASPEQLRKEPLTPQTDIFSLGVVMYELLTGSRPFQADTSVATFYKITMEDPEPLQKHRRDIPESLQRVVSQALAKKPQDRHQSGLQLASQLSASFDHLRFVEEEISLEEKVNLLKKIRFFGDFTSSELVEVLKATKWVRHEPGSTIITEGALEDSFYVILSGEVQVKKQDQPLAVLKPGDCFGEMAYLGRTTRTATTVARTETILMKINASVIDQTSLTTQLCFYKVFTRTLIQRLIVTSKLLSGG